MPQPTLSDCVVVILAALVGAVFGWLRGRRK